MTLEDELYKIREKLDELLVENVDIEDEPWYKTMKQARDNITSTLVILLHESNNK